MVGALTRYSLFLKAALKNRMTWVVMLMMAVLVVVLRSALLPDGRSDSVMLCGGGPVTDELIEELLAGDSSFEFIRADEPGDVMKAVADGSAECGFIFPEDMKARIDSGDMEGLIVFVTSPFTVRGMAARETVYSGLLRYWSAVLLEQRGGEIFVDSAEATPAVLAIYEQYLDSDSVFSAVYEDVEVQSEAGGEAGGGMRTWPVHGAAALMLLMILLLSGERRSGKGKGIFAGLSAGRRFGFSFLMKAADVTLPAIEGLVLIRLLEPDAGLAADLIFMAAFILYAILWSLVFEKLLRRDEPRICLSLLIVLLSLVVTPVFWEAAEYVPALSFLRFILPNGAYLSLLTMM